LEKYCLTKFVHLLISQRKIREAERLRKEEEQKIADEKAAQVAKKNAFLNRANAFQQKKGPSDEEVKAAVHKASDQRKFGRQLNNALKNEPGKNAFALELGMKNRLGNDGAHSHESSPWELVTQAGEQPYYWNKVTNETTFDKPDDLNASAPPPPPPPPRRLPGMQPPPPLQPNQVVRPPPPQPQFTPPPPKFVPPPPAGAVVPEPEPEPVRSDWVYVFENEPSPYYWNTETDETTFDRPDAYIAPWTAGAESTATEQEDEEESAPSDLDLSLMWQEVEEPSSGETQYVNMASGEVRKEQPNGTLVLVVVNSAGEEDNWQVCVYEGEEDSEHDAGDFGTIYYQNMRTGELSDDRPDGGTVMIIEKSV
jgi:hypothetical protein